MVLGSQCQIFPPYLARQLLLLGLMQNPSRQLEVEEHHLEIAAT
jgi:hypothetical protein